MLIELELNINDTEALLRHCADYQPDSGDFREDSRLAEALEALMLAIKDSMSAERSSHQALEMIETTAGGGDTSIR